MRSRDGLRCNLESLRVKVLESIQIHHHGILSIRTSHHARPASSAKEVIPRTSLSIVGRQRARSLVDLELREVDLEPEVALAKAERAVTFSPYLDLRGGDGEGKVAAVAAAMVGLDVFLGHGDVWGYCDF